MEQDIMHYAHIDPRPKMLRSVTSFYHGEGINDIYNRVIQEVVVRQKQDH